MKILAIDDDPIILDILAQQIDGEEGLSLLTADSGVDALELLAGPTPPEVDCILVDVEMPGMDGAQTVRHIRAMKRYRDTPIMMLTSRSEKRYIDAAFAAGAVDYLTKPFDQAELHTRLNLMRALANRAAQPVAEGLPQYARRPVDPDADSRPLHFYEPFSVYDVENLIDIRALENYVLQLNRSSLFGSACFALSIRGAFGHFQRLSEFEFKALISDVAEVISDTLFGRQYLMAYAGNGIFICVTEGGWFPDTELLSDSVNLSLARTELYNNKGETLHLRIACGEAGRLVWKSGRSLLEALADAHASAEEAAETHERELKNLWATTQPADATVVH